MASDEPLPGKCGARVHQGLGFCTQAAGKGTPHPGRGACTNHGGSTPNHVRKAELERFEEAAVTFGLRRDVSGEQALLEEIQWTAGHVAWLRGQVQELDPGRMWWGPAEERDGARVLKAGAPAVVTVYQAERRHLVDVCRAALAANVAERQVRLAEAQGALLVAGLQALVAELTLSKAQLVVWGQAVPRMLRGLASGAIEVAS